jgi:surface polysaccharide O-acyltransferase-like enzyme
MSVPVIPPRAPRLAFIDNLRWSAISMVVVMHAAVTYSPFGSWYVREHPQLGLAGALAFATYQSFQHAVSMGLLFGIAGYFAASALARKSAAAFLRERAFRLGLPLLLYVLVIGPVTQYVIAGSWRPVPGGFGAAWLGHLRDLTLFQDSGPLWFCFVLLLFCLCFTAYRAVRPAQAAFAAPPPGLGAVGLYALAMAAVTFVVGGLVPHDRTILNVDLHDFPQYPLMFAAGTMAYAGAWPLTVSARAGRWWLGGGLAVSVALWVGLITLGGALQHRLAPYGGGWHWQAAGIDLWRSVTCLTLSLGLITLYRDHVNGHGPVARFLTRNAFGVYVFHAPILILTTEVLRHWPLLLAVKFALASIVGIVATFLFVGIVARRVPLLRAIV